MAAPKPITLVAGVASATPPAPQPFALVGGFPAGALPAPTSGARGGIKKIAPVAVPTDLASMIASFAALQAEFVAAQS